MPPATDWHSSQTGVQLDEPPVDDNPHAGVAGAPDEGGGQMQGPVDPNAELPPNHPSMSGQPLPPGAQSTGPGGLPPPDPNRAIDPSHRVAGTIKADPKLAGKVTEPTPMFIFVKRVDAATGNPTGFPIASQRVVYSPGKDFAFELTDHDIMTGVPEQLTGDVFVMAHVDHDGDAITKTSGDLLGQAKVTLPAGNVTITLDTAIP